MAPTYKDTERNSWYAQFYYTDWNGEKKRKKKRGFKTQREAKEFEREFLLMHASDPNMNFETLLELYYKDCETRIRPQTLTNKKTMIEAHIRPYFKRFAIADVTNADIRRWQNQMLKKVRDNGEPYSQTYLRAVNSQISAIFNFAVEFYGLAANPCAKVKSIGKKQAEEMHFWTLDQFNHVMEFEDKPAFHLAFMILYWGGLREGEALALTPEKIDYENKAIIVNQTYHRVNGQDVFGPTKTDNSVRVTAVPSFLFDELTEYSERIYGIGDTDRIFYFTKTALNKELDRIAALAGEPRIRVHDLRHSHVALLIELGYRTHAIADRIGDTAEVVDRTYAHLYPNKGKQIAKELERHQNGIASTKKEREKIASLDNVNILDFEAKIAK